MNKPCLSTIRCYCAHPSRREQGKRPILTPWRTMSEPNVHGWTRDAISGARSGARVEVVRCYVGEWEVFAYVDGKHAADGPKASFGSRGDAMRAATLWLCSLPSRTDADIAEDPCA